MPDAAALPSEIAAAFAGAQRRAVLALLRHWAGEQLDEVHPSDLDALDRRIAQLEALDALAGAPARMRGLFFAVKRSLDDPYLTPAGPPRAPADELPGYRDLPAGLIAAVEAAHRIELHRRDGDDYVLEVPSRSPTPRSSPERRPWWPGAAAACDDRVRRGQRVRGARASEAHGARGGRMSWRCSRCGETHEGPPDIAFDAPWYRTSVPEAERARRCTLTADFCSIDDEDFFVRGCLEIPLVDGERSFAWGVWMSVSRRSFERAKAVFDEPLRAGSEPFVGWLSSRIPGYPDTLRLVVRAHLRDGGLRPAFELQPTDHPLAVEQREGITLARLRQIQERVLHLAPGTEMATPRLDLRRARLDDLPAVHRLWTEPEIRRFLFDGAAIPEDQARALLEASAASFAERGFGIWLAHEPGRPELAGFAGLLHSDAGAPNLVYGVRPDLCGRGLASEAARAVLDHALGPLGLAAVNADVDEPNAASVRVLEKLGMMRVRSASVGGRPLLHFQRRRD